MVLKKILPNLEGILFIMISIGCFVFGWKFNFDIKF